MRHYGIEKEEFNMTRHEYVHRRNALIPLASREADHKTGPNPKGKNQREMWNHAWNKIFHTEMNRLARAEGLTS